MKLEDTILSLELARAIVVLLCIIGLLYLTGVIASCSSPQPVATVSTPQPPPELPRTGVLVEVNAIWTWNAKTVGQARAACSISIIPLKLVPVCGAMAGLDEGVAEVVKDAAAEGSD